MKAAITLNPSTPVAMLSDIIQDLDMVLLMSVNPGFGGQKFIPHTLTKVKELKDLIERMHSKALIEVDGGVSFIYGGFTLIVSTLQGFIYFNALAISSFIISIFSSKEL